MARKCCDIQTGVGLSVLLSKTVLCNLQVTMHCVRFCFRPALRGWRRLGEPPTAAARRRLAAALPYLQPGHVQLATSLEFQPAAVSMAAASAAACKEVSAASATSGGLPAASASNDGTWFCDSSKEGTAACGASPASQPAKQSASRDSAISSSCDDAGGSSHANDDTVMTDMTSGGGQQAAAARNLTQNHLDALGASGVDATAAAVATAAAACPSV